MGERHGEDRHSVKSKKLSDHIFNPCRGSRERWGEGGREGMSEGEEGEKETKEGAKLCKPSKPTPMTYFLQQGSTF